MVVWSMLLRTQRRWIPFFVCSTKISMKSFNIWLQLTRCCLTYVSFPRQRNAFLLLKRLNHYSEVLNFFSFHLVSDAHEHLTTIVFHFLLFFFAVRVFRIFFFLKLDNYLFWNTLLLVDVFILQIVFLHLSRCKLAFDNIKAPSDFTNYFFYCSSTIEGKLTFFLLRKTLFSERSRVCFS